MKLRGQNLIEYILIAAMLAIAGYAFVSNFDMKALKNYVFMRPADPTDNAKIKIEAMTP